MLELDHDTGVTMYYSVGTTYMIIQQQQQPKLAKKSSIETSFKLHDDNELGKRYHSNKDCVIVVFSLFLVKLFLH